MQIEKNTTVAELAANLPGAVRLFEKLEIDYCCGGKRALEQVCAEKNLSVNQVLAALNTIQEVQQGQSSHENWPNRSLGDLVRHIVDHHHSYIRRELPRLEALLDRMCNAHGPNRPEFLQTRQLLAMLADELTHHLMKEEQILFPYIEELERAAGEQRGAVRQFASVEGPIQAMIQEHENAGELLSRMQNLLTNRTGCNTTLEFFRSLDAFEKDLHQHIHLENNILFPRAISMEASL